LYAMWTGAVTKKSHRSIRKPIPSVAGRRTREIVLAMSNSFAADGHEYYNGVGEVEIQSRAGIATVLVKGITPTGPVIAAFHGCPPRDIPFTGHVVNLQSSNRRSYMKLSTSPGFLEIFSLDGTRLLGVQYCDLENGAVRKIGWGLNMSSPKLREYACYAGRLVMHLRSYPIAGLIQPSVVCLDRESNTMWSWEKSVDIISINVNAGLVLFLVAPSVPAMYSFQIINVNNGKILRVLELNLSPTYVPKVVLTDTHFIFSQEISPNLPVGTVFGYDIGELLDDEDDQYLNPWQLQVPATITSNIQHLQVSTDGRYIAAMTSHPPNKEREEETTMILWDMKHTMQDGKARITTSARVQRLPKKKKGVFSTGIWVVERVDGEVEVSYSGVNTMS
jgi:hypothetical protein